MMSELLLSKNALQDVNFFNKKLRYCDSAVRQAIRVSRCVIFQIRFDDRRRNDCSVDQVPRLDRSAQTLKKEV